MDLDDAFANAAYIPDAESYPPKWAAAAQEFRNGLGERARCDIAYGTGPRHVFDLFLPTTEAHGLVVFVHGGYWKAFDKSTWSHLAAGPLARGWAVAMPSYTLAPDARISEITEEITQAVQAAAAEIAGPVRLTGHSAGGHLVSRMLEPGRLPDALGARLRHVLPISPVADLRPLVQTTMNDILGLDTAEAEAESPIVMPERQAVPVTVWVGAEERPVFVEQATALADSWLADLVIAPGRHHFDVIEPLADPDSDIVNCLLE